MRQGVGVVSGAMDRNRSNRNEVAVEGSGDREVHASKPDLGRVQIRDVVPVPRRAHGTVDQHGCSADDLARGRDDPARTSPITGRSRSQRRLTVD
jgi:hypothetical protein